MRDLLHFIGGERVPSTTQAWLENRNPATGQVINRIARGRSEDIHRAVEKAREAFPAWCSTAPAERARLLNRIADLIDERAQEFAELESLDQGKPVSLALKMDIPRVALNFRFFAGAILHHENESTEIDQQTLNVVLRKPIGVCGLISPWNLPLYLLSWKIAPALAAGNTVVCKPSEMTSMTADLLTDVLTQAGLPKGVVNIVYGLGPEAGEALVRHPDVPLISFTGGTSTGRKIIESGAENFKKLSLELGGKNPNLIFKDADLDAAVNGTIRSSFLNQGEICLCGSRIYVQEEIFDQFMDAFIPRVKALKVGDPRDPQSFMGPLVSKDHLAKVKSYVEIARQEGGRIWTGGEAPRVSEELKDGYWYLPTVITGLSESSRCVQEEIFGPVVTVAKFKDLDEAIEKANGVVYGLSASAWTKDLQTTLRLGRELKTGTLWVNTWLERDLRVPFGGQKASGIGREGGRHSLEFFTEATTLCVRY